MLASLLATPPPAVWPARRRRVVGGPVRGRRRRTVVGARPRRQRARPSAAPGQRGARLLARHFAVRGAIRVSHPGAVRRASGSPSCRSPWVRAVPAPHRPREAPPRTADQRASVRAANRSAPAQARTLTRRTAVRRVQSAPLRGTARQGPPPAAPGAQACPVDPPRLV